MDSILKRLAGASLVTLMLAAGPALAQDQAPEEAPAAAEETTEAPAATEAPAMTEAPAAPTPEVQAMIDGLAPEVDQAFWCASAFSLISSVSENPAEVQGLTEIAQGLLATARETLPQDEVSDEDFGAIASGYNLVVLNQFEAEDETAMPYSPNDCFDTAGIAEPAAPGAEGGMVEVPAAGGMTEAAPAEEPTSEADAVEAEESPSGGGEEDELLAP